MRDFARFCFDHVNLSWEDYVRFDETYLRPTEVDALIGDASKAEGILGWKAKVLPPELATIMVDAELELEKVGKSLVRSADA